MNPRIWEIAREIITEQKSESRENTSMELETDKIVLGEVDIDKSIEYPLIVTNIGDKPLLIKDIIVSCRCIIYEKENKPILPGEKTNILF